MNIKDWLPVTRKQYNELDKRLFELSVKVSNIEDSVEYWRSSFRNFIQETEKSIDDINDSIEKSFFSQLDMRKTDMGVIDNLKRKLNVVIENSNERAILSAKIKELNLE